LPKGFVKKWEETLINGVRTSPQIERESQVGTTLKILTNQLGAKFEVTDKEAQKILKEAQAAAEQRRKKSL
jgi:division protein CdvB (Snf7/Vps24/ESCRT-III family)